MYQQRSVGKYNKKHCDTCSPNMEQQPVTSSLDDNVAGLLPYNLTLAVILQPVLIEPVSSIVAPIVFAVVFLVGMIGNLLQLFTVVANRTVRRSPPNVLIACLAVADLVLLVVCVPLASTVYTLTGWPFGRVACKLSESVQTLSVAVSVLTLAALSGDRYIAIVHPLTALRSTSMRRTLTVVAVIWIASTAAAAPDFIASEIYPIQTCAAGPEVCDQNATTSTIFFCSPHPYAWGDWYAPFRATMRMVLLFLLPLEAIAAFYCGVACVLLKGDAPRDEPLRAFGGGPVAASAAAGRATTVPTGIAAMFERQDKDRKRVAKVVMSFVVVFIICWLPRHVYLMFYYWTAYEFNEYWHAFKIVGFCLTFVYSCINPLALYLFSEEFRRYFDHYLFGCCCPSKRLRHRRDTATTTYDTNRKRTSASTVASTPNNISLENLARL